MYVRELCVHYRSRRCRGPRQLLRRLDSAADAALIMQPLLAAEAVEVCGLLCVSAQHHLLAYHELSRGTTDAAFVHPREVFKVALLANATAVIVGHNHPSGDPSPSADDLALTRRLKAAGDLLGIDVLDHLIVGADRYVSLKESGHL